MPIAGADAKRLTLKTLDGESVGIDSAALTELKAGLRGELLTESAPEYDPSGKYGTLRSIGGQPSSSDVLQPATLPPPSGLPSATTRCFWFVVAATTTLDLLLPMAD